LGRTGRRCHGAILSRDNCTSEHGAFSMRTPPGHPAGNVAQPATRTFRDGLGAVAR
jgi:hypothetical protein